MKSDNKSQVRLWMAMIGITFSNVAMKFWQVRNRQIALSFNCTDVQFEEAFSLKLGVFIDVYSNNEL